MKVSKKINILIIATCFLLTFITCATFSFAEDPQGAKEGALKDVQITIDQIIAAVQKLPGKDKAKERRAELRKIISPRFNFKEMSVRSLGRTWNEINPQEQEEFTRIFSDLLAKTYLSRIETVQPGMVKFDGESLDYPRCLVKTTVTKDGEEFPIHYKLLHEEGTQWKVYDVVIENIGLVANYRNEFSGIVRREGFKGLMERLREKNDKTEE